MEVAPQGKTVVHLIWHRCCCLTSSVHPCRTLNHLPFPHLYNTNGVPPSRCNLWIDTGSARCKKGASTLRGTKKVEEGLKKTQCMITIMELFTGHTSMSITFPKNCLWIRYTSSAAWSSALSPQPSARVCFSSRWLPAHFPHYILSSFFLSLCFAVT